MKGGDMGLIEEGRQLIQDFVTPEVRLIDARLTAVEKRLEALDAKTDRVQTTLDTKIDRVQTTIDIKIDRVQTTLETKIDRVQSTLDAKMDKNQAQVMDALHRMEAYSQVLERLARVESKLQSVA
jgi:hypothetical protein